ncbi:inositol 2-dehydrogenase [Marivita hallyeonensis]|uniref:Myo-inositol 2-dehydrogenase n=1 Tax=Marivita hallyeonensis TaxID=996342 RepID=A0A1M5RYC1_9RHOB|nr:inositol 2-dehydrogenase [Marivita hallyeonensis]SHH31028.1 myo-inositol 2-dehydrogenase [Marivita hallyeonensis]
MIRFGLLGCGRIGQVHASSIAAVENASLIAVADAVPAAAETLAAKSGAEVRSSDEIIAAQDIDAVIIASPTTAHYDQIHALAKAGKAIFCEKPLDLSSDRAAECARAVKTAGVAFLTGFNRRFDPDFSLLQRKLSEGVIGRPELVVITSRDPAPPPISYIETSGGLFRDMMIHDFDMARFLLGEEITEVFATGSCLVDPGIGAAGDVDTAMVTLKTESGALCQINNSRRAVYGYDQRIEVHGARGMLQAANQPEHRLTLATAPGFATAPNKAFFLERYAPAYRAEIAAFVAALTDGRAPDPGIDDGVQAQKLADAATQSHHLGKPIRL